MLLIYSGVFYPIDSSMIIRNVAIWSVQDLPRLNQACLSRSLASPASWSRNNMIRLNIFLVTNISDIP